jgi:hypothetical protein
MSGEAEFHGPWPLFILVPPSLTSSLSHAHTSLSSTPGHLIEGELRSTNTSWEILRKVAPDGWCVLTQARVSRAPY